MLSYRVGSANFSQRKRGHAHDSSTDCENVAGAHKPNVHHRRECPEITYMAMGVQPHSFPVGGVYVKGVGRPTKVKKKITRFSVPLLLKRKKYFTNPSCVPHWERKTSPRSTALVNRISLQPFLRTRSYPAPVLCSATAVGADFAVRLKARQDTRQVLKGEVGRKMNFT